MPLIVVHGGRLHVAQRTSIHKHTTSPVTGQRPDWQSAAVTMPPLGVERRPPGDEARCCGLAAASCARDLAGDMLDAHH